VRILQSGNVSLHDVELGMTKTTPSLKRTIVRNVVFGIVIGGFVVTSFHFVARAVSPGTVINPTFAPTQDDVSGGFGIPCNWSGQQMKLMWTDGGGDQGCMGLLMTCTGNVITAINTGILQLQEGGGVNVAACGTPF